MRHIIFAAVAAFALVASGSDAHARRGILNGTEINRRGILNGTEINRRGILNGRRLNQKTTAEMKKAKKATVATAGAPASMTKVVVKL